MATQYLTQNSGFAVPGFGTLPPQTFWGWLVSPTTSADLTIGFTMIALAGYDGSASSIHNDTFGPTPADWSFTLSRGPQRSSGEMGDWIIFDGRNAWVSDDATVQATYSITPM